MLIRDYQYISSLNTGSTTYEYELAKYFNIDTTKTIEDVRKELVKCLETKEYKLGKTIYFNKKEWLVEQDILDSTFEQWVLLETILSEDNNINNLHKLIALYLRPVIRKGIFKKKVIEPFNMNNHDKISIELLDLPIEIANALIVFFWNLVPEYMNNIKTHYLNLSNHQINTIINQK